MSAYESEYPESSAIGQQNMLDQQLDLYELGKSPPYVRFISFPVEISEEIKLLESKAKIMSEEKLVDTEVVEKVYADGVITHAYSSGNVASNQEVVAPPVVDDLWHNYEYGRPDNPLRDQGANVIICDEASGVDLSPEEQKLVEERLSVLRGTLITAKADEAEEETSKVHAMHEELGMAGSRNAFPIEKDKAPLGQRKGMFIGQPNRFSRRHMRPNPQKLGEGAFKIDESRPVNN